MENHDCQTSSKSVPLNLSIAASDGYYVVGQSALVYGVTTDAVTSTASKNAAVAFADCSLIATKQRRHAVSIDQDIHAVICKQPMTTGP